MRLLRAQALALCVFVASVLCACRGCDPEPARGSSTASAPAAKRGVLIGSVRLAPGHDLPAYSAEDMERKVLQHIERSTFPEGCTPPKIADRMPVRTTADGKLIGVMVAASEFAKAPARAPRTHEVTIRDCRLTPSFVVAMKGDTLRVRNDVDFPFMPTLGSTALVETLSRGQTRDTVLTTAGATTPLLCGFTAPCGRTDVVVVFHPLYAVTDENGNFRIEDFPVDETINVNAWHPLFAAQEQSVRVGNGEKKSIELVISPAAPNPATSPAAPTAAEPGGQPQ